MSPHKTSRPRRRSRIADRPLSGWFRSRPRLEWMEDRTLLSTFLVSNTGDSGPGSLRQAILDSNAATGATHTINFDIPGSGVQEIAPLSPLPAITNPVLIDGFSQPGDSGAPLIELSGSQAGVGDGLLITGPDVTVRGLDINNFSQGAGIHITSASATGDWVYGSFLGTDPTGTQAEPNNEGVEIDAGASNNLVGTNGDGVNDTAERNLLSGNSFAGVWITGQGTNGNAVAGNLIGTSISGDVELNNGTQKVSADYSSIGGGVVIQGGASDNRIGTDGRGIDDVGERNVIAGSGNDGIDIYGDGTDNNIVAGNFIGTDATGSRSLGVMAYGVFLVRGASNNWIGVNPKGGTDLGDEGNVISGNGSSGVQIFGGSDGNAIAGNKIGTDVTGTLALGNSQGGVQISYESSDNTIGGDTAGSGNLITNNGGPGVVVGDYAGDDCVGNQITANRIFGNTGQAIDLGDDGVTYDASSPRQGANNLQNFPIIVTPTEGQRQGVLWGSLPDTTYRIVLFASAADNSDGSGEAEDYLGSMEVTTDASGQAVFAVPFSALAGLPFMTATATDPPGNTSEVSALRRATVKLPPASIRVIPNQALSFSTASSDGIAIQDPDAGPLDPMWDLTLSVGAGTLTLPRTAGLTGSGNGTASLSYSGSLTAIDAALEGLVFNPPAGPHVLTTLTVGAQSVGAPPLQTTFALTDGVGVVDTTADSGPGSLRQAILDANNVTAGLVTIDFDIPDDGVQTIEPITPLPAISVSMLIDGTSQPGFAGTPLIALGGQSPGSPGPLAISSGDVTIRGLAVDRVAIDPTAGERLIAVVADQGGTSPLSLLDAQGHVLVENGGASSDNPDDVIDEHLAAGDYSLALDSTVGPGAPTWTTMLMPSSAPFQEIPVAALGTIVAGDFIGNGRLDLAVSTGYTNDISVLLGNGDGTFQPAVTYAVGLEAVGIVAGDFTGDGHLDLAVADYGSNDVSILLGNGDGTFRPAGRYAAGSGPVGIVAGDFTGDGHLDLAVEDGSSNDVSILLGNGDGTFRPAGRYAAGSDPSGIVAGDFTGDGHLDLAVVDRGNSIFGGSDPGGVSVLLGNGDGTFQPAVQYAAGASPDGIVAGDFTGDGHLDLAVSDEGNANGNGTGVSVLLGNGDGTFQPAKRYAAGFLPIDIVAGDFTGNGILDLAVTDEESNSVFVLLGNGDGTFQPATGYAAGNFPLVLRAGDFNGDGRLDLAVADFEPSQISVLLGNGDGTFQTPDKNVIVPDPTAMVAGDFTRNGRLDLAVADGQLNNEVSVLIGNGDGTFNPAVQYPVGSGPVAIVAGDFNGDGRLDLAVADLGSNDISILMGNGDGTFQPAVQYAVGLAPDAIVAGDFSGDGRLDLAVADLGNELGDPFFYSVVPGTDPGGVSVLIGNGDGTFQPAVQYAAGIGPSAIVAGDFTGDGKLDLAVADVGNLFRGGSEPGGVSVLLGNGDGAFQPAVQYAAGSSPLAIVAGDFTSDSHLDLAVADFGDQKGNGSGVGVLLGNGDGTFQPAVYYAVGLNPEAIVAGDFTGDGHLDLAVAGEYFDPSVGNPVGEVAVLLGNGDGTFQPALPDLAEDGVVVQFPSAMVAGDFTGDGHLDLAVGNPGSSDVSMLLGNGDGTFTDPAQLAITTRATPLVADVNGDGTDDVLVVDGHGNILYRQGIPGQHGSFLPPVTVNPGNSSRDIAWVPDSLIGPLLASVDAHDNAISLYAYRNGGFVRVGSLTTGQLPPQIIAADLDGSGFDDLVVRNAGDGTLTVFFNNQLGSFWTGFDRPFLPPLTIPVGLGLSDVQAIGTNDDGHLDLVVTNKLTGQVGVLYNKGDHTFAALVPYRAGTGLSAIDPAGTPEVTSLDGTAGVVGGPLVPGGPTGLVTINPGSNTMDVLAGLGGRWFANPVRIQTPVPALAVRVADFNHDGIDDLAVLTANGVSIYLGNGEGGFSSPVTYNAGVDPTGLTVADLLGNGQLDLLVGNVYGDVLILVGDGHGTFRPFQPVHAAIALAVADLTGDGSLDFVFADQSLDRVSVVYGAPGGKAPGPQVLGNQATGVLAPGAVLLHDLNGDGIPDLIVANSGGNNVLVYPGLGNGQFGPPINGTRGFPVGTDPTGLTVADLNGQPDLLVADTGSNDVSVLLGQGSGSSWTMIPGARVHTDAGPVALVVGNLLGGTQPDLAVANSGANNVQVFPGVGSGFFNNQPQATRTYAVGQAPSSLFLGNFNGSGLGLATLNAGSNDGALISGLNTARPVIQTFATGGASPTSGFAGDFTHDGFTDLVVGNNGDGHLALLSGGAGGLTLSQTLVSPEAPNPTSLSFAGVSDGLLSFYVSTAGREAALHLTFDLEGNLGLETGLPPGSITPTASSSPEAVLSQATTGAVQQVSQLLNLSGTTLDLAATLLTVSVLPGNLEGESAGSAAGTVGTTGFGQPVLQPRTGGGPGDSDEPPGEEPDTPETRPTVEAERIPAWARISIGLDRVWERARAAIRELEGSMAAPEDAGASAPSPAPTTPRLDPAGRARGSTRKREETPTRSAGAAAMSPLPAIDAVLAAWDVRRPEGGPRVERNAPAEDVPAGWDSLHWPRPLAIIAAGTATIGLIRAWGPRGQGFRRKASRMIGCQ
jgi:hypothetical protein